MDYESKFEELKGKLEAAILEAIWVPNELLPERYHENREGGSTAEAEKEIPYQINEHKLYRNEQAFAVAMELELEEEE